MIAGRLRQAPTVLIAGAADGYLAYCVSSGRLHRLNPAASLVVELCEQRRSLEAVRDLLLPLVGEEGWAACAAWIETAVRDGLLIVSPTDDDVMAPLTPETLT